jgi:hypothetical protein
MTSSPLSGWFNCESYSQLVKRYSKPEGTIAAIADVLASLGLACLANNITGRTCAQPRAYNKP